MTADAVPATGAPDGFTKVYGAADLPLTYRVTGLQSSDTAASVLKGGPARDPGEHVGAYKVTQGTLASLSTNYTLKFTGGTLGVTPALTSTVVTPPPGTPVAGQLVTFAAAVSNASGTPASPAKSVQFVVDGVPSGPGAADRRHRGEPPIALAAGGHTVEADYSDPAGNFMATAGQIAGGESVAPLTTANLQAALAATPSLTLLAPADADLQADLAAVNGLAATPAPSTVTIDLGGGTYSDATASPPAGVTLVLVGNGLTTTIVGSLPRPDRHPGGRGGLRGDAVDRHRQPGRCGGWGHPHGAAVGDPGVDRLYRRGRAPDRRCPRPRDGRRPGRQHVERQRDGRVRPRHDGPRRRGGRGPVRGRTARRSPPRT